MAKYKKRADGRYCKQIMYGYHPDGRKRVKTIYAETIRELEDKEMKVRRQIEEGVNLENEKMPLKVWCEQWLKVYKENTVAPSTYSLYQEQIERYIVPKLGDIPVSRLKQVQVQSMLNDIVSDGHSRTAELVRATVKQIIRKAAEEGLISRNICENLSKIKKTKKEKRVLTEFELYCIANTSYNPREQLLLKLLYYTGIRRGEALALHRDDINENKRTLMITKSLDIKENTSFLKSPKSNAGIRELPIPDALFELIEREVLNKKSGYLFTTKEGKHCTRSSFRKMWESIMKKTKQTAERLKKEEDVSRFGNQLTISFTPHIFRHTYATNLYYAGVDLKRTQYLLGHSSLNMTLEVYTHMDYAMGNEITTEKINSFYHNRAV